MRLCPWDKLPEQMQTPEVRPYYEILRKKQGSLVLKRCFDVVASLIMIVLLSVVLLVLAVWIKLDSKGPVFYRQERVTQYGRHFRIFKFRTMVTDADKLGALVTTQGDPRITHVGGKIRSLRLDELPQLFNILTGDMSFVGTRPEVPKYVEAYTNEMWATLLLPAGVTSQASIRYKDESALLDAAENVDEVYTNNVLPAKMQYNLYAIRNFSFFLELKTMVERVLALLGKSYPADMTDDSEP